MKLWLLRPREDLPAYDNPWEPWYDKTFGFVVRAASEDDARELADSHGGAEVDRYWSEDENRAMSKPLWRESRYATCVELTPDGEPGIVIEDTHAA